MSFVNRFKPAGNNPPPGVKMEHTSFGYAQNQKPYTMPPIPKQTAPTQKIQPRGGWGDDDDEEPQLRSANVPNRGIQAQPQGNIKKPFVQSPLTPGSAKSDELSLGPSVKKSVNPAKDYELMQIDDSFLSSHEYENKTINDLVQPGGARVKPADPVLNNFCKACESFPIPVVGSLLLSKLYEDLPFITKARTLYLIEALVKKVKKYYEYFKYNLSTLQGADYSNEGSAEQLIKISKDIAQYIEQPNKPKPQPIIPTHLTSHSPTIPQTTNLLGGDDLLGSPEAKNTNNSSSSKPDPFGFVKKQTSETTKTQTPSNRTPLAQNNNNQLLDFDFGSHSTPSQPQQSFAPQPQQSFTPQTQSFIQTQPQVQAQVQPKKFNPFEIPSTSANQNQNTQPAPAQNVNQNTSKPSGLPGNFKKFQGASSSQEQPVTAAPVQQTSNAFTNKPTTPVNQNMSSSKMDDLLGSFSGLDLLGNNSPIQQAPSQPPQTTNINQGTSPFNAGYQASSPGIKSNFGNTQAPSTQPFSNQTNPMNQGPSSYGQGFSNTPSMGFNNGPINSTMGQPNRFGQPNQPTNPQMYPPYGGPGNMGPGPAGFGYNNSFPAYGQGPSGFNNAPVGNWNTGFPTGPSGFNAGPGYGYGQPQYPPSGNFGQPQNFGGNNFPQGFQNMSGPSGYQNQPNMQGMNAYHHINSPSEDYTLGGPLGLYSEEAIAKNEELKKKHEKTKNEALFDSLRF